MKTIEKANNENLSCTELLTRKIKSSREKTKFSPRKINFNPKKRAKPKVWIFAVSKSTFIVSQFIKLRYLLSIIYRKIDDPGERDTVWGN